MVFKAKRGLKKHKSRSFNVFISEDLTKKRQAIIKSLAEARKKDLIISYWTSDGRIFYKQTEDSDTVLVPSIFTPLDI